MRRHLKSPLRLCSYLLILFLIVVIGKSQAIPDYNLLVRLGLRSAETVALASIIPPSGGNDDREPSVGVGDCTDGISVIAWARDNPPMTSGLLFSIDGGTPSILQACTPCYVGQWQPCVAVRSDGHFIIAWADWNGSAFQIVMQLFNKAGTKLGGEVMVSDDLTGTQRSPAVAFDDSNNVVVAWVGATQTECPSSKLQRIFARRYSWDDQASPAVAPADQNAAFIVDLDPGWDPLDYMDANPTVSLTLDTDAPPGWPAGSSSPGTHQTQA